MKREIVLSAIAVLAVGCTVEMPYEEATKPQMSKQEITILATREDDPETKTVLNATDGAVLWTPGDAISLFYGSGANGGSRFASNATEPSAVTNFTGTITAITGGADVSPDETYFWGVYPYRDDVSCDGSSITMTLPTEQVATPGTFATGLFPSIGRSQGLVMGFYNVCGGWRFSVTKEGVRKVTLKSNGGEYITGKVKVGLNESGIPVIREIIDGSDEVVLECPRGEYFEVGRNYYMIVLPTVFESGFTMTFETYTEEGSYNRTARTTVRRSGFSGIANLDSYLTTPYAQKTGNIPVEDANFKAYLVANFDTDSDGEISYAEAAAITSINTWTDEILSVQGIEYIPRLASLSVQGNYHSGQLVVLDVTNNTALKYLYCESNQLTTLDVSNNTALYRLRCDYNQLTTLDVSHNTALTRLECYNNQLSTLDVSNNTALTLLYCVDNQLTTLDVSNNTALTELYCAGNELTTLDVSNNRALTRLGCAINQLTTLDVSNNTALTGLGCQNNHISTLDMSNNPALTSLACHDNQLTSLDVSNNTALTTLWCYNNQLTTLDLSRNLSLTNLDCAPMPSLETLKIAQGQTIPNITSNRSDEYIPAGTQIVVAPTSGGSEGTGDEELNP